MSAATDPLRQRISNIGSGLEHLWEALQYKHDRKIRKSVLALSIRCLILHMAASGVAFLLPNFFSSVSYQLFYPAIFLYRYIQPGQWDKLFMGTVRSLGCSERPDVVAKPCPEYFTQLKQYCRRSFKAYVGITIIQWLVNRTGIFRLPSLVLSLVAVNQILQYKGIKNAFWKLILISLFIGPKWPVWVVQTALLQQLFMYELLQPYLARVNFKGWEERAWLAQNEAELRGFAFGAHLLCSIPLFGAAAIPFMFPAVAFLLTRSCGSLMNSSHGLGGDVIERQSPGVKSVALGKSKSVEGNWDEPKVTTFVRNTDPEVFKPQKHSRDNTHTYSVDKGLNNPVDEERIHADKELSLLRKADLYRQAQFNARRARIHQVFNSPHVFGDPLVRPDAFLGLESTTAKQQDSNPAYATKTGATLTNGLDNDTSREDFAKYNFSDRKTLASAPSAPPAPSDYITTGPEEVFRVTARQANAEHFPSVDDNGALRTEAQEHEYDIREIEQKRRAADAKKKKAEQIRTARKNVVKKAHQVSNRTPSDTSFGNANTESETGTAEETEETESAQDEEEAEAREKDEEKAETQKDEELHIENECENESNTVSKGTGPSGRGGFGASRGCDLPRGWRGGRAGRGTRGFARGGRGGRGRSQGMRSNSQSNDGGNADDDASVTGRVTSDEDGLSGIITRGVQDIENYMSQQAEGLGNQLIQKLWDVVVTPENLQQFKFKIGGLLDDQQQRFKFKILGRDRSLNIS
ncbi:hypothetical protein EDD21DRAFT_372745 [Dissophora ornata]|nr:hypothetical protein BGZ58_003031 [Dissophora ornata]KAI8602116.1 hypothetical protein EDD21DRAFT_372745 [Dissophora ornata]